MKHYIITRINVINNWIVSQERPNRRMLDKQWKAEYLDHRVKMFHRFTVPSILSQTDKNFEWLVLIHPDTLPKYKEAFYTSAAKFVEAVHDVEIISTVKQAGWIATTNLDSDDALSFDFVETLKKIVKEKNYVICFKCGMHFSVRSNQGVNRRSPTSSNQTLIERGENPKTICSYAHGNLNEVYDVQQIQGPAMWLQTVHGLNVENHKVRHSKKSVDISFKEIRKRFKINDR